MKKVIALMLTMFASVTAFELLVLLFQPANADRFQSGMNITQFATLFAMGIASYCLFKKHLMFLLTLEHEMVHMITAFLCGIHTKGLQADRYTGGRVLLTGSNFMISLAPYFVPSIALILLLIRFIANPEHFARIDMLIVTALGFGIASNFDEFSLRQPDIKGEGIVFSLAVVISSNLLLAGGIALFLIGGTEALTFVSQNGYMDLKNTLAWLFTALKA